MAGTTQNRFEPSGGGACPLDPAWRLWDIFPWERYTCVDPKFHPIVELAESTSLSRKLETLLLPWRIADDDGSQVPMTSAESGQPDWKYPPGCPFHIHADAGIDGNRVHIDWFGATKCGPGRSFLQIRIFVEGEFAGLGKSCACSLGFSSRSLPAVALVGEDKALRISDGTPWPRKKVYRDGVAFIQSDATTQVPIVELWERSDA